MSYEYPNWKPEQPLGLPSVEVEKMEDCLAAPSSLGANIQIDLRLVLSVLSLSGCHFALLQILVFISFMICRRFL